MSIRAANARTASLACDGDGQSGPRVQELYVRGVELPTPFSSLIASVRAWAAEAGLIFQQSAVASGGSRQIRFVHHADCEPVVLDVAVTANALGSFNALIQELRARGHARQDRIYLSFVDTTSAGICGVGTIRNDDRPSAAENRNNISLSYSRVDRGCWNGKVAAHELMHNLGGVQHSAPNTTVGFHCTDEYDVMCYRDGANSPPMRTVCANSAFERLLNCGRDDYFHTAPAPGSYLATHWSPANSQFLIGASGNPGGTVLVETGAPQARLAAPNAVKGGQRVRLGASATDKSRIASVAFGVCLKKPCTWEGARKLAVDRSSPYRAVWKAPKQSTITILARATDRAGNTKVTKKSVTVKPAQQPRRAKRNR